jgi:hypothetical protein
MTYPVTRREGQPRNVRRRLLVSPCPGRAIVVLTTQLLPPPRRRPGTAIQPATPRHGPDLGPWLSLIAQHHPFPRDWPAARTRPSRRPSGHPPCPGPSRAQVALYRRRRAAKRCLVRDNSGVAGLGTGNAVIDTKAMTPGAMPPAEVQIDVPLVRRLLAAQFPLARIGRHTISEVLADHGHIACFGDGR